MENLETEVRIHPQENQMFRLIFDQIYFLIFPDNPTFHLQAVSMQETKVFNTVKESITNLSFLVSIEKSVTDAIIIDSQFKLKYIYAFMEDQYSQLGEKKAA